MMENKVPNMDREKAVIIKKDLKGFTGIAWLVQKGKKYYVVSGTNAMFSGWEVLVFPATEKGKVISWGEVAGGRGITMEEAIKDLEDRENIE